MQSRAGTRHLSGLMCSRQLTGPMKIRRMLGAIYLPNVVGELGNSHETAFQLWDFDAAL